MGLVEALKWRSANVKPFAVANAISLSSVLDTSAATTILSALASRRGSQVVRSRSAKPLFAGSIPAPASLLNPKSFKGRISTRLTVRCQHIRMQSIKGGAAMPTTDAIGEQVIEAVIGGPE